MAMFLLAACQANDNAAPWEGFTAENALRLSAASVPGGLVVFDADGTLWKGDAGEDFLHWQLQNGILLPERLEKTRQAWEQYEKGAFSERDMWILAATCQEGLPEDRVRKQASDFFTKEMAPRIFPGMKNAVMQLKQKGMDVWIVSASHRWIIQAGAPHLGIEPDHVIAISAVVKDGLITGEVIEPVPFREGKVDAIRALIGRTPNVVFGDSVNDVPMLKIATTLGVTINPKEALARLASENHWATQTFN